MGTQAQVFFSRLNFAVFIFFDTFFRVAECVVSLLSLTFFPTRSNLQVASIRRLFSCISSSINTRFKTFHLGFQVDGLAALAGGGNQEMASQLKKLENENKTLKKGTKSQIWQPNKNMILLLYTALRKHNLL